jgi:Holliday junction resolvase RusA-like endonuclease
MHQISSKDLVLPKLKSLLGDPLKEALFLGNPVPASRPRVTRWGTYYAKTYSDWKKKFEAELKEFKETITVPCFVIVEAVAEKAKTSKLFFPRADVDNYCKSPLDVLTKKKCWEDDSQIIELFTSKRFAEKGEEQRVEVSIYDYKKN